jgi:hypothetical protein
MGFKGPFKSYFVWLQLNEGRQFIPYSRKIIQGGFFKSFCSRLLDIIIVGIPKIQIRVAFCISLPYIIEGSRCIVMKYRVHKVELSLLNEKIVG